MNLSLISKRIWLFVALLIAVFIAAGIVSCENIKRWKNWPKADTGDCQAPESQQTAADQSCRPG